MKFKYFRNAALLAAIFVTGAVALPQGLPPQPTIDRIFFLVKNLDQRLTALEAKVSAFLGPSGSFARLKQERVAVAVGETRTVSLPVADAPVLISVAILQSSFVCAGGAGTTRPTVGFGNVALLDSHSGITIGGFGGIANDLRTEGVCPPPNQGSGILAQATIGAPYNSGSPLTPNVFLHVSAEGSAMLNEPVIFVVRWVLEPD